VKWLIAVYLIFFALSGFSTVLAETKKGEGEMTISTGKKVSIEYTLKLEDNAVVDTNVGTNPLTYVHGSQQIIPGLEKEMEGMKIGDSKQVTVNPEEGYGPVNKAAFVEVNKEQLPQDALQVGVMLKGQDANGQAVHARVAEIKEKTVVLDHNHPLAGKTLNFEVKVLDIKESQ
jgi:FKBP-type peptidyl-prolyl cis-trans isomerase SlyD